ncbi:MAG: carbohydrate-binding protein, partial [Bacteroidales bacterium]|nr:carbohydrate-binding protein [Bacteroidales bacterium]
MKLILSLALSVWAGAAAAQNWQLVTPAFEQTETVVAGFVVGPNDFSNTNDVTNEVQNMLNQLNNCGGDTEDQGHGGGVLYFKSGHYKFRGQISVPKGVTIRGDWQKPVKGQSLDKGAVFEVYWGANKTAQGDAFIKLHSGASVHGITFWYPEQTNYANPTPYSHTILLGKGYGWSAEFNFVRNVTFVNAYSGIYYQDDGGTCPNVNGVYGTPMVRGVEIDNIVDIGRLDKLDFSPDYWAGSGFAGSPTGNNLTAFKNWLYNNGVGVIMRRNDWSYTCYLTVDGYNKGFYSTECKRNGDSATPNGHNYGFNFSNCKYGLYHDGRMGEGVMFTNVNVSNCEYGCYVSDVAGGTLQLLGWNFVNQGTNKYDIYVSDKAGSKVHLQQSTVRSGRVVINGGSFAAVDNDFSNIAPQVEINKNGRGVLLGNRWTSTRNIAQNNVFENTIDDTQLGLKPLPAYTQFTERNTKPAGNNFVLCKPYGNTLVTRNNVGSAADATTAINNALTQVKNAGGGVVYLAPGHYRINGQINIPSGVELKGSTDVGTFPLGPGSYLDVYNRNSPAVLMQANSGLRGVHFDYPEQVRCTNIPNNVIDFPFTIKGNGDNIYIVNVGTRCSNRGVDMNGCNNFYINYLTGYFFREGVNVKNSSNGIIANMQCNTQVYNNGYETKYGQFPNSYSDGCAESTDPYTYNSKNLDFLTMEDVTDIFLYNDFNYNTLNGIVFKNNVSGLGLGFALDDDRTGLLLDGNNIKFEFINLQCVALERGGATPKQSSYITATSNYGANSEVTLFGSDYWGNSTMSAVMMENGAAGTINLYESNFMQINSNNAFNVNGGTLNVVNSTIASPRNNLVNQTGSGKVNIIGSFTNPTGNPTVNKYNSQSGLASDNVAIDRSGWTIIASYSNGGNNTTEARKAIDGNSSSSWTSGWQNQGTGAGEVWLKVDMGGQKKINEVLLEYSNAPNDGPQTYQLQVSNDNNNWNTVASGNGGSNMTIIEFPEQNVRYFRVVKPASTKANFWAVYELYAFNVNESATPDPDPDPDPQPGTQAPYGGAAWAIPGTIQAENFDEGGQGVAYNDNDTANQGGYYRTNEGVDIGNGGTGYNIGWTNGGEWTKYTVTVASTGTYTLTCGVSSDANGSGTFSLAFDGVDVTGNITAQSAGWDNYTEVTKEGISLTAGDHVMTFNCGGGMNIDYFTFTKENGGTTPDAGSAFNGPHNIYNGAVLEAEDFDNGGEGVAYHDQETGHQNAGTAIAYRNDVDVEIESYGAGDYNIGFTNSGEWLMYTINVTQAGQYTINANCASGNDGGKYYYELDGNPVGLTTTITKTGSWSTWQDFSTTGINLTAGTHKLKWYTYGNLNLNKFTFVRTGDIDDGGQGGGDEGDITKEMYNPLFVDFTSPLYEGAGTGRMYTADPSAHVFNNRLYVYASHDMEPAVGCDHMDRYHIFSTTDMKNWTDHGEAFGSNDVPWGRAEGGFMWAPDCAYNPANQTYYYYFPHPTGTDWGATWKIGIATSKDPAKNFQVQGYINGLESLIDPCVFVDDDGQPYIYHGGGGRCMGGKLDKNDWTKISGTMTVQEGLSDFHEGTWVFKRNGVYYLMHADNHGDDGNQLKYATSNSPLGPWTPQGVILYATGCDTSHGSIVEYKGQWYLFYHTSNASGEYNLRSVCVDPLYFNADGTIQVVKNWGEPYNGTHTISVKNNTTDIALKLEAEDFNTGSHYGYWDKTTGNSTGAYRTDVNVDIANQNGATFVGNMEKGEWLRYTVNAQKGGLYDIDFYVASGNGDGKFHVSVNGTKKSAEISVPNTGGWTTFQKLTVANIPLKEGEQYIDIRISNGFNFDRMEFRNAQPYSGRPYNGPHDINDGAVVEAEDFDEGGEGTAYHDNESTNQSGAYRT